MFVDLIGRTMEVYIDDMIVKSKQTQDYISPLWQTFVVLRKYNMKLNPAKCSFGVTFGKFLGNMVTKRGMKPDLNQIKALKNLQSPRSVKEVQKLTRRLAVSANQVRIQIIWKSSTRNFEWKEECERSFNDIKEYLSKPPLLAKLSRGKDVVILGGLAKRFECCPSSWRQRHAISYLLHKLGLLDAETTYTQLEKLSLALVMASRKLRPYFQTHPILVVTTFPLCIILSKPDISGQLANWIVELGEYGLEYQPWTTIKSQVLVDFITNFTFELHMETKRELFAIHNIEAYNGVELWTVSVDGSSNSRGVKWG